MFVVTLAAVTELVLGFRVNMSELFATLITGRPEVDVVLVEFFIVVLALFDGLVTKDNEIPLNMEDVVGRDVLRDDEVRVETVVGFVLAALGVVGFDIVPGISGALDIAGRVIVNVLIALIVTVWLIVMSDVAMLAMGEDVWAEDVWAWAVIVSVRVTVVVLTFSTSKLVVVSDVLNGSIDI